jgi:hypothetical protein
MVSKSGKVEDDAEARAAEDEAREPNRGKMVDPRTRDVRAIGAPGLIVLCWKDSVLPDDAIPSSSACLERSDSRQRFHCQSYYKNRDDIRLTNSIQSGAALN